MPQGSFPPSQRALKGYGPAYRQLYGLNFVDLVRKGVAKGIDLSTAEAQTRGRAFFNALDQYKSGKGGSRSLASAHQRIASQAQQDVLEAYDESVTHAPGRLAPYRVGENRFSGGALRRAISNPAMFEGSYQGIAFINPTILDREARHWQRLNYGAGERGSQGPIPFAAFLTVFGQQLGALTPKGKPRPAFRMPRGVWVGQGHGEGSKAAKWGSRGPGFYPTSRKATFPTKGIRPRRFFDAAYASIERNLPIEYDNLLDEWVDQASRLLRGPGARAVVNGLSIGRFVSGR